MTISDANLSDVIEPSRPSPGTSAKREAPGTER